MNLWNHRPPEEQRLLNPSFCSILIWYASYGHSETRQTREGLTFEECFLILPMVLHREIRESLPNRISTSLPVWLGRNTLAPSTIASCACALVPFTKDALSFGGIYGMLQFNQVIINANLGWQKCVTAAIQESSDEVRDCAKRAKFLGKWFAKTSNTETVLSLLGVQP